MLIRWVNDDQRLEQAEPCWSPRGKRCSPSSWESVKTRSKQIVRKINSWGFGPWLGVKVKVGWCPLCVKGSLETRSAFRPIYKQWCVYSWVVSRNGVEFEVTAALVIWVLYIYKTPWKKKNLISGWFLRIQFMSSGMGVCAEYEDFTSAHLGFKGSRIFFLVSVHPAWVSFVHHLLSHHFLHTDLKHSHETSASDAHTAWLL